MAEHIKIEELSFAEPIRKWVEERYGENAQEIWDKTCRTYNEYLKDAPDYGGKESGHGLAIYGGLLIFALYPSLPDQPPITELQDMVNHLFMGKFTTLGKIFTLNRSLDMRLINLVFAKVGKQDRKDYESEPSMPDDLCYLSGQYLEDYLHDVEICQSFARRSREKMAVFSQSVRAIRNGIIQLHTEQEESCPEPRLKIN